MGHPRKAWERRARVEMKGAFLQRRLDFAPAPCLVIRPGLQRFELGGDGLFSLASELNAGGALG